jgi:hypothetical protein
VRLLELKLTLYQLPRDDATVLVGLDVPAAALHSVTYTSDEISVLTSLDLNGSEVERRCLEKEPGWQVFKIEGPLDLSMTGEVRHTQTARRAYTPRAGVLWQFAGVLKDAQVPLMATSTFNTDYIAVKGRWAQVVKSALQSAGWVVE